MVATLPQQVCTACASWEALVSAQNNTIATLSAALVAVLGGDATAVSACAPAHLDEDEADVPTLPSGCAATGGECIRLADVDVYELLEGMALPAHTVISN